MREINLIETPFDALVFHLNALRNRLNADTFNKKIFDKHYAIVKRWLDNAELSPPYRRVGEMCLDALAELRKEKE